MNYNYIKAIKRMVSARDVCDRYGIEINRNGKAHCIFHSERTASMMVYDGERGFYCFGCGARGDCLDLVQGLFNISRDEAAEKINTDFSLHLPIGENLSKARQIEVGKMLFENKRRLKEKEAERQALMDDYFSALELFSACQLAMERYAPINPDDELNPVFVYACMHIDGAEFELEEQETRRWKYDNRSRAVDSR